VIVAGGLELRAGAQLLLEAASFQVAPGDKIGLVGRNGAGKTTLARVLAGEGMPAAGSVRRTGTIGYLPQDSRAGDLAGLTMDRVLSARGLDEVRAAMRAAEQQMADRTRPAGTRPSAGTATPRSGCTASAGTRRSPRRRPSPPAWGCPAGCCPSPW